jgi:hypothetical protein
MIQIEHDQRSDYEQTILRKAPEAATWLGKSLDATEEFNILIEPNGLGVTVAICSIRAESLLMDLHADVFSGFVKPHTRVKGRVRTAWFGYSEPLDRSVHYVSMQ